MAANFYFVFVEKKQELNLSQFLSKIGFEGFNPQNKVGIWETSKPETLYVGEHNGYFIFAEQSLPSGFYKEKPSKLEKLFINEFPNSEISAYVLNESVGIFGFSIIKNGERIRIKLGGDGEMYIDIGEKLPIELLLINENLFQEEELEEMKENNANIGMMLEIEGSFRATGELISKRLGIDFYTIDNEVVLTRYE